MYKFYLFVCIIGLGIFFINNYKKLILILFSIYVNWKKEFIGLYIVIMMYWFLENYKLESLGYYMVFNNIKW